MNLSTARATAADAIRAAAPSDEVLRVVEVDTVEARDIPTLADGLFDAALATSGTRGPAVVAVMARGRQASQAIDLTAFTIVRSDLAIELAQSGRGRGLATLDLVEDALSKLPVHGLPRLLVESTVAPLDPATRKMDTTVYVYITRCTWPPAHPDLPLAVNRGGSMEAIRETMAGAVTTGLPADVSAQVGETEAERRVALIDGLVPRAGILLQTQRETLGGGHDLAVIANQNWTDDQGRRWTARVAQQDMVATVTVWHRTESLADEAVARIMGELDQATVAWPGSFDALVLVGNDYVSQRLTGAEYEQLVTLLNRTPAVWDAEQGLMMGKMQCTVQSVTQLRAANESVGAVTLEHTATWR